MQQQTFEACVQQLGKSQQDNARMLAVLRDAEKQLTEQKGTINRLQGQLGECRTQGRNAQMLRNAPEGRIVFKQCLRENNNARDHVLVNSGNAQYLGVVDQWNGVLGCAALARKSGEVDPSQPTTIALLNGGCYLIKDAVGKADELQRHGPVAGCAASFDNRGSSLGNKNAFAMYGVLPAGAQATRLQLLRPSGGPVRIVGAAARGPGATAEPYPVRGVESLGGENAATAAYLTQLQAVNMNHRRMTGSAIASPHPGHTPSPGVPRGQGSLSFVYGEAPVLVTIIELRAVEDDDSLVGCMVQLLDVNGKMVFRVKIDHGALDYRWTVV